jgi:hypothetical protein
MKRRILERPDAFRKRTELDDKPLDRVLAVADDKQGEMAARQRISQARGRRRSQGGHAGAPGLVRETEYYLPVAG